MSDNMNLNKRGVRGSGRNGMEERCKAREKEGCVFIMFLTLYTGIKAHDSNGIMRELDMHVTV